MGVNLKINGVKTNVAVPADNTTSAANSIYFTGEGGIYAFSSAGKRVKLGGDLPSTAGITTKKVLTTDGTTTSWGDAPSSSAKSWTYKDVTGDTSLTGNDFVRVRAAYLDINLFFPSTPADGDRICIMDVLGTFRDFQITLVAPTGTKISGFTDPVVLNVANACETFNYIAADKNWKLERTPLGSSNNWYFKNIVDSTYFANSFEYLRVTASTSITFPASPVDGDRICIMDSTGIFDTAPVNIIGNGKKIMGSTSIASMNVKYACEVFQYIESIGDWRIESTPIASGVQAISTGVWI